ncbi:MAG: sugar phosphate isomerase/epimerase [Acidobacteria bacterium]|nr:sugar phosphate isomerase/epimerase [Acidobacteriota bacterium]
MRPPDISRRFALLGAALPAALPASPLDTQPAGMRVGVASYTFRKFSRADAIAALVRLGVRQLSVKEFHLPYASSPDALQAGSKEFTQAGLNLASGGVIVTYREDNSTLRRYFEYAKSCGFPMLIWMPNAGQLPLIEKLVQEFDIRVAIHNHGPEDKNFPTPASVHDAIRQLDRRIGLCLDVGHSARAGVDVPAAIKQFRDRLIDVHLKDLRTLSGHSDCEIGKGVLPIPSILRTLRSVRYQGNINLEFEADADAPESGLRASLAYVHGVLAGLEAAKG